MAAVEGAGSPHTSYPLTVLTAIVCAPCALINRIWQAIKSLFSKIKEPTADEIAQKKHRFEDLTKQLKSIEGEKNKQPPAVPPINIKATVVNLGKPVALTVEGHHSNAIQGLRVLTKQIVTILAYNFFKKFSEGKHPLFDQERDDVIADIGHFCDILTDKLTTRLEDPKFFPMLFDNTMTYLVAEAKAHAVANNDINYQSDKKTIDEANQIIGSSKVGDKNQEILAAATGTKVNKARLGGEHLLQEIYYEAYRDYIIKAPDKGNEHLEMAENYALEVRNSKATEWGDNRLKDQNFESFFTKLDPNYHDRALELHLQNLYSVIFVKQKEACSTDVENIFKAMSINDANGKAQLNFREYIKNRGNSLLERALPAAQQLIGLELFQSKFYKIFWKLVLNRLCEFLVPSEPTAKELTYRFTEEKSFNMDVLDAFIHIREKTAEFFEKWILATPLMSQLSNTIYPSLQKQFLKMICRKLIQARWQVYAPLIHVHIMDRKKGDDIKNELWKEMTASERIFSLAGDTTPFNREAFNSVIDELLESCKQDQLIVRSIINEMPLKIFEAFSEEIKKLIETGSEEEKVELRIAIKARLIQACDVYNDLLEKPGAHDPNIQDLIKARYEGWNRQLDPLVEKFENRLIDFKTKNPAEQWTKENVIQTIKSVLNGEAVEETSYFGEMSMQLGFNFAHAAPWTEKFQFLWGNSLKSMINKSSCGSMEAYRISPDELAKTITETLQAKFINKDKNGLDPQKVISFFLGDAEAPKADCKRDLDIMSKQLYELTLLYFPKGSLTQNTWRWAIKAFGIGDTPDHLRKILTTLHEALFGMRVVNLSRVEKIIDIVNHTFDATAPEEAKPEASPETPTIPATPVKRTIRF